MCLPMGCPGLVCKYISAIHSMALRMHPYLSRYLTFWRVITDLSLGTTCNLCLHFKAFEAVSQSVCRTVVVHVLVVEHSISLFILFQHNVCPCACLSVRHAQHICGYLKRGIQTFVTVSIYNCLQRYPPSPFPLLCLCKRKRIPVRVRVFFIIRWYKFVFRSPLKTLIRITIVSSLLERNCVNINNISTLHSSFIEIDFFTTVRFYEHIRTLNYCSVQIPWL